ncbi:NAD(P)-binding protein [Mycena olivaceomarginata]|nr:NAD(P)-binding protein [Mycena olivaceomarginata]
MSNTQKLILVIGATGAQGQAVVDALLAPDNQGNPSPYTVRALTRDPASKHALELAARGVECVKGSFEDLDSVARALDGAYGAWVNTDGFTVGEIKEIYFGMRIFETAKRARTLRHYVWSSLPYVSKITGFDPEYKVDHMDAKARVADWLRAQPSVASADALSWSIVTTDRTWNCCLGRQRPDSYDRAEGPGWWARYTFDHRPETSGSELNITSEHVGWDYLVETFTKVTGKPAVFKPQSLDEWWTNFDDGVNDPVASDKTRGDGSRTIRDNFLRILAHMDWIRRTHPGTYTLERWMRESDYQGRTGAVLKNAQEGRGKWGLNTDVVKLL